MEIEVVLEKIKELLLSRYDLHAFLLFGSYARKSQTPESDIDLAIKTSERIPKLELFQLKNELEEMTKKDVDLIDLNADLNDVIQYEIVINGKLLYCKNQIEFDMYKIKVMREYVELNEARQGIIQQIKKEGKHNGK